MGGRAFEEEAREDDLATMVRHVQDAVKAGAMGFSTSRSPSHSTSDERPVASRVAPFAEVQAIVRGMGEIGAGIFQLAMERGDVDFMNGIYRSLSDLSIEPGRPLTFRNLRWPAARCLRPAVAVDTPTAHRPRSPACPSRPPAPPSTTSPRRS